MFGKEEASDYLYVSQSLWDSPPELVAWSKSTVGDLLLVGCGNPTCSNKESKISSYQSCSACRLTVCSSFLLRTLKCSDLAELIFLPSQDCSSSCQAEHWPEHKPGEHLSASIVRKHSLVSMLTLRCSPRTRSQLARKSRGCRGRCGRCPDQERLQPTVDLFRSNLRIEPSCS